MTTLFPSRLFRSRITDSASLLCASEVGALSEATRGGGYQVIPLSMSSGTMHIALRGFKIMNPPRQAKSHGSNAVYLASGLNKRDGLLLQYLPPNSVTSWHYHAETAETFHLIAGNAVVSTPWGVDLDFEHDRSVTVRPFTVHQVKTGDQDSLILLEMLFTSDDVGMKDHFHIDPTRSIDVCGNGTYPASKLSNFAAHVFMFDDVECSSIEGFLQSLKERDPEKQREICKLTGKQAKARGIELNATRSAADPLFWKGKAIDRGSEEYQFLLDCAYEALATAQSFRTALFDSEERLLIHTIGKKRPEETILTEWEFCSRLLRLRYSLRGSIRPSV